MKCAACLGYVCFYVASTRLRAHAAMWCVPLTAASLTDGGGSDGAERERGGAFVDGCLGGAGELFWYAGQCGDADAVGRYNGDRGRAGADGCSAGCVCGLAGAGGRCDGGRKGADAGNVWDGGRSGVAGGGW